MNYSIEQWLLIFFMYGFLGWVWESSYVSIKSKEWINRGFLYGPIVPIYGCGAVIVLVIASPFATSIPIIFFLGVLGAGILEYVTGALMEHIFKVRYWDYSQDKFNLNGYICLKGLILWGVFSVLLITVVHPYVHSLIVQIPNQFVQTSAYIWLLIFVIDLIASVHSALNLKTLLMRFTANNELLAKAEDKLNEVLNSINDASSSFQNRLSAIETSLQDNLNYYQSLTRSYQTRLIEKVKGRKRLRFTTLAYLKDKTETLIDELRTQLKQSSYDSKKEELSASLNDLDVVKQELTQEEEHLSNIKEKQLVRAVNILRKNPLARSFRFKEAFNEFKALTKTKKK